MNMKTMVAALIVTTAFGGTFAEAQKPVTGREAPQVEEKNDDFPVKTETRLSFDTKYLSYGFVDDNRPMITPYGGLTFVDWLKFDVKALFDVTKNGRRAGYHNRAWQYIEIDPAVHLVHEFKVEDIGRVAFDFSYWYEYHPRSMGRFYGGDSQFATFQVGLLDVFLEPVFYIERDFMRDDGVYANLELGQTFALIEKDEDHDRNPLEFRLSVAQGLGNSRRVAGYARNERGERIHHGGLMDTMFKATLTWNITDNLYLTGYAAYSDFLFDRTIRDASRHYEASGRWDESYNFIGGLAIGFNF